MFISCEVDGCISEADLQCTCDKKFEVCSKHFRDHSRICKRPAISTEELLAEQIAKILEADKCLENLKDQILKDVQSLISKITKKYSSIIYDISTKQSNLIKLKLGRKWDSKEFDSVRDFGVIESQHIKLCSTTREIFEDHQIKSSNPASSPARRWDFNRSNRNPELGSIFSDEPIYNIDPIHAKIINRSFYARRTELFHVAIHRATYMGHPVAIKMYEARSAEAISAEANFEEIEKEIKCYQYLSRMSTRDNCFLPFYGTYIEGYSLNLVMDYYEKNLMFVIARGHSEMCALHEETLFIIFKKLLTAFATMEAVGIIHGDIKPHHILTDDNWNMKIINFSASIIKNTDICEDVMGNIPVKGTRDYMAPELEAFSNQGKMYGS